MPDSFVKLVSLIPRIRRFDKELFKYLSERYENFLKSIREIYGIGNYNDRVKNMIDGVRKEYNFLRKLVEKDYLFFKAPNDFIDCEYLFSLYIDLVKDLLGLLDDSVGWIEKSYYYYFISKDLGSKMKKSWKQIYIRELAGFPDFAILLPRLDKIVVKYYEIKRKGIIEI